VLGRLACRHFRVCISFLDARVLRSGFGFRGREVVVWSAVMRDSALPIPRNRKAGEGSPWVIWRLESPALHRMPETGYCPLRVQRAGANPTSPFQPDAIRHGLAAV